MLRPSIYLLLLCFVAFLSSCEKDELSPEPTGKPTISLAVSNIDVKTLKPSDVFITLVGLKRGGAKLRGVSILEDDKLIGIDRIKVNNLFALGNPVFLYAPNDESGSLRIEITAPNRTGSFNYKFILTDYKGDTSQVSRRIIIGSSSPTLKYNGPELAISTFMRDTKYKLNGIRGTGKMVSMTVLEDNQPVSANRITFGTAKPVGNPFIIDMADQSVFDKDLSIVSGSVAKTVLYTFIVTDEFGAIGRDSARVLIGTPTTELTNKELFNYARGGNFGAISLTDGSSVDSLSPNADIIDQGIDTSKNASVNWLRQIRAGKNVEIKRIFVGVNGVVQSFSYSNVFTREQIIDLFSRGFALPQLDAFDRPTSDIIQTGQIFVVKKGSNYFLLEVPGIIVTPNDNLDIIRFNIKK
jgi:hypothetical protein